MPLSHDKDPNALDSLAKRLAKRPGTTAFAGDLTSGPTKFRVLPADPNAAKKPRVANGPGQYTLGDNAQFVVSRRPVGERIANEANIQYSPPDATKPAPGKPHKDRAPRRLRHLGSRLGARLECALGDATMGHLEL